MQAEVCMQSNANRTLRAWVVLVALTALQASALAQMAEYAPTPQDRGNATGLRQQKRAALRAALQAQREAGAPKTDRAARQLTQAERAKLREQLRQQRRNAAEGHNG